MTKKISLLVMLLSAMLTAIAETADNKNLSHIQAQIQTVKQDIEQQQTQRDQIQQTLKATEIQLGTLTAQQQQTAAQQKTQQATLKSLNQKQAAYEKDLAAQQAELARQIRLAYMSGHQEFIKLLLSQDDPTQISRNLTYYRYLAEYQSNLIQQLNTLIQQVTENEQAIAQHTTELLALQTQQKQQLQAVQAKRAERSNSLKQLNGTIRTKADQLQKLLADKATLDQEVKKVQAQAQTESQSVGGPVIWPAGSSFAGSQGKLSWPTRGKIIANYNSPIEQSELKQTGVLIGAPEGQNVYAVAPGRVAFADWMSGYGLLMIIDHGEGYMTLYGRNGTLYKQVGDKVAPGDRIATVGKTGGYSQPSLYFAIRRQVDPLNPSLWCR